MRPALVHEDEPLRLHRRGHHHSPGRPRKLLALGGDTPPFFLVGPMRAMARHTVERLTESTATTPRYSQRSLRVAKGRSFRSSSKSFMAFSSSFGAAPGLFFAASDPPRSALCT